MLNINEPEEIEFWVARGKSIQAYAILEDALATLFSALSSTRTAIGRAIFFKIVNTDARMSVIDMLLTIRHGYDNSCPCGEPSHNECLFRRSPDKGEPGFFRSLEKRIRHIDKERNKIVHWAAITTAAPESTTIALRAPANMYSWSDENAESLTTENMNEFSSECHFMAKLCRMFSGFISPRSEPNAQVQKSLLEIFQQPITYPPPEGTPLHTMVLIPLKRSIRHPPSSESPPASG